MDDLTNFFGKEASSGLVDHSWLSVDPKEYAKTEALPRQNLDIVPDLASLWSHEDKPAAAYLMPNSADKPKVLSDLVDSPNRSAAVVRVARLTLIQTTDAKKIHDTLSRRFSKEDIFAARAELAQVFAERGLLGNYYLDSQDFPTCAQNRTADTQFVSRYASSSRFLLSKDSCQGCTHNAHGNCAVFHKQLVPSVDSIFTEEQARKVEQQKTASGKLIPPSNLTAKARIRNAFLAGNATSNPIQAPVVRENPAQHLKPVQEHVPVVVASPLIKERESVYSLVEWLTKQGRMTPDEVRDAAFRISLASTKEELASLVTALESLEAAPGKVYDGPVPPRPKVSSQSLREGLVQIENLNRKVASEAEKASLENRARPIVALLRREILKGHGFEALKRAVHLSFDPREVVATRDQWVPILSKAGFLGTIYTRQDLFANCSEGVSFLNKYASPVRYVVKGSKCDGCIHNKIGRCLLYNRPLIASEDSVLTAEEVKRSADNLYASGRVYQEEVRALSTLEPKDALKEIYRLAHSKDRPVMSATTRMDIYRGWGGEAFTQTHHTNDLVRRDIVAATKRYMNEGLYGKELGFVLRKRFDERDLKAAKEDLRSLVAEQGLQGIFYVDPSIYADYGKGCNEPSRLFRASAVPYLKVGSACAGCLHQTKPGFCSKISKPLVVEPPYVNKEAQRAEVLTSGNTMVVPPEQLINSGVNMLAEFQMQNPIEVEFSPEKVAETVEVSFGESDEITWLC